jgi:hypothetical protein
VNLGFDTGRDILDVLLVPLSLGLLAILWPTLIARKRRANFKNLIRRELMEAAPYGAELQPSAPWHEHLSRRFLHEEIIAHPTENIEFVLSLNPGLAYHLSQLWIAFGKAVNETKSCKSASYTYADQFRWHLGETIRLLDRSPKSALVTEVLQPWSKLIAEKYPDELVKGQ